MGIISKFRWNSPPCFDSICIGLVKFGTLLSLKLFYEFKIINIFRNKGYFVHYLNVLWPKRADDELLMVHDAPVLHIGVHQCLVYHVIVWHELRACSYFMNLNLCYNSEFSSSFISLFISKIIWAIPNLVFQDYENLHLGPDQVYNVWCGTRHNVQVRICSFTSLITLL
jgi:hypothetical protein